MVVRSRAVLVLNSPDSGLRLRFLATFVTDVGKLIPRRHTRLPAKLQRRVARAVKTARAMAVMPYEDKLSIFSSGGGGAGGRKR